MDIDLALKKSSATSKALKTVNLIYIKINALKVHFTKLIGNKHFCDQDTGSQSKFAVF